MKKNNRGVFLSVLVIIVYFLSACSGTPATGQQLEDHTITPAGVDVLNANDANSNTGNQNDSASNSNDTQDDNSNSGSGNDNSGVGIEQEVSGVVEALTTESITINGVTYAFADFTEFKDVIALGDQVKLHVLVNADGTFTIREIEKSDATGVDDGNSNSNGLDDNSNNNGDDNNHSNDDNGSNNNGNDDSGSDDNGNDQGGGEDGGNGNG
jgi:Domain of unknown function (DUF5666)